MAIPTPRAFGAHEISAASDERELYPGNHLISGNSTLARLASSSALIGQGADVSLTRLAVITCSQTAVVGWRAVQGLRDVGWDKAWLPAGAGAATRLWCHLLEQAWTVDFIFSVTWNRKEDLLYKGYFRFLRKDVCYPYDKDTKDVWFTAVVTRQEQADGKNTNKKYEIKALNSTNKAWTELSEQEEQYIGVEGKLGYWYHGTRHDAAVNILEEGINLGRGMPKQDFSNGKGFYMSPKFTCAKKWASLKQRAAVLVFNVRKPLEDENFQVLDLRRSDAAVGWGAVVKHNRCGNKAWAPLSGELRKKFDKSDYIIGPMAGGKTKCPSDKESCKQWHPQRNAETCDQLCIMTERVAEVFGSLEDKHIEAVIFYGD